MVENVRQTRVVSQVLTSKQWDYYLLLALAGQETEADRHGRQHYDSAEQNIYQEENQEKNLHQQSDLPHLEDVKSDGERNDPDLEAYRNYFGPDGRFRQELVVEGDAGQEMEDYQEVEEVRLEVEMPAPYTVKLHSVYEEGLTGSHLANRQHQRGAMEEWAAGQQAGPGEMGNGILLEDLLPDERLTRDLMRVDHAFDE